MYTSPTSDLQDYADDVIDSLMGNISARSHGMDESNNDERMLRAKITYYLMGIAGTIVCILGIIGNLMSLLVLTRRPMRLSSTYTYLSAIAICDSLVLLFTFVILLKDIDEGAETLRANSSTLEGWSYHKTLYPYLFPYVHPLACTFQVTSIWLTLAFTVDRYIMICHPLHASPYCTITRARLVVGLVFGAGVLYNLPKFFEYRSVVVFYPDGRVGVKYDITKFGRSVGFKELYNTSLYVAFVCLLPLSALAVMNAALMRAVRESRCQGKKRLRLHERKRNDTTLMLIGVVVIFFMCQTPAVASHVIWAFYSPMYQQRLPFYFLNEIANFLVTLNSAVNIVPYYFFGRRFREEFCRLFCCCSGCLVEYATAPRVDFNSDARRSSQYSGYSCNGNTRLSTRLGCRADSINIETSKIYLNKIHRTDEIGLIQKTTLIEEVEPNSVATEPNSSSLTRKWPSTKSL